MSGVNYPYTAVDLTAEINRIEDAWSKLRRLGLFPSEGITSRYTEIAREGHKLKILGAAEPGEPGTHGTQDPANSVVLKVPHIPHQEVIKPEDLQDSYVFGTGRQRRKSVQTETARKLARLRRLHSNTLEFLRVGALKGEIRDGYNRLIYDLFNVFNVTKKVVNFELSTDSTDVRAKCHEVVQHMEDNLYGETMDGVRALVSPEFFDKLVTHPNVEKWYQNWAAARGMANLGPNDAFPFGGVAFETYRAASTDLTGATRRFIAADRGHAYPTGTTDAHQTVNAPPYHVDFANTRGPEVFVSPETKEHGKGVELQSQANPLPVWTIPELLVELQAG